MAETVTILNVDDHAAGRYAKRRILIGAGFQVYDAATGAEALEMIARHDPDLVLLDVNLPDVNGLEVCRRVKASPGSAAVIVLQISAMSITPPEAATALEQGADAYLVEPVDAEVLVATIRALLRLRKAERELSAAKERLENVNRELQRSNEDLQHFSFAASHDLQEPLRSVTGFVGLLQRSAGSKLSIEEREFLKYIADGAARMRTLIDDLLTYAQVGRRPASAEVTDLNQVLNWALENLHEGVSTSGADIVCDPLPSLPGDETQLRHVFQNLIGNAIKYATEGVKPVIHVDAARETCDWVVRVRDNGIGIESDYLQTIFSPFQRLHGKEIPGTGIGLAVCRRAVEAHGGKIWVESTPGQGSTFCFTLPA